jgi:hypothetical protein
MGSSYILPKLLYVSLYTLYGSAIGYIAIFYDEAIHRTPQEIGVLLATPYFVQVRLLTKNSNDKPHSPRYFPDCVFSTVDDGGG